MSGWNIGPVCKNVNVRKLFIEELIMKQNGFDRGGLV